MCLAIGLNSSDEMLQNTSTAPHYDTGSLLHLHMFASVILFILFNRSHVMTTFCHVI